MASFILEKGKRKKEKEKDEERLDTEENIWYNISITRREESPKGFSLEGAKKPEGILGLLARSANKKGEIRQWQ